MHHAIAVFIAPCEGSPARCLDEPLLREHARAAIRTGKFPARRAGRTWGGPGIGAPCSVCAIAVTKDQMEIQIEFARDGNSPGLGKYPSMFGASRLGNSRETSLPRRAVWA